MVRRSRPGSRSAAGSGRVMGPASVSAPNGPTMSGLTTSWRIASMTDGSNAC
jgi:hypothetical protein